MKFAWPESQKRVSVKWWGNIAWGGSSEVSEDEFVVSPTGAVLFEGAGAVCLAAAVAGWESASCACVKVAQSTMTMIAIVIVVVWAPPHTFPQNFQCLLVISYIRLAYLEPVNRVLQPPWVRHSRKRPDPHARTFGADDSRFHR